MFDRVLNMPLSTKQVILHKLPQVKRLLKGNVTDCKIVISNSVFQFDDSNATLNTNRIRKLNNSNIKKKHLGSKNLNISIPQYLEFKQTVHCVKSVQIRSDFWSVFFCIQSEYRKIRTRNYSVFGHLLGNLKQFQDAQILLVNKQFRLNSLA